MRGEKKYERFRIRVRARGGGRGEWRGAIGEKKDEIDENG